MSGQRTGATGTGAMSRRRLLALTAGGSLAAASMLTVGGSAAAQTATTAGTAKQGGSLRVVYAEEPKNLHPQIDSGTEGWYVIKQIYDGLLNMDSNGKIVPGLAKDMPEQPDPTTMIFHLRQNVTFHNGKPFTADDVIWTFDRLLGKVPKLQSTQQPRFAELIKSYEKVDDSTVKIVLNHPSPDFFYLTAAGKYMSIMQKDAELANPKEYGQSVVVGTGPFKFKEWVKGDHLTLVRNDTYWATPAHVDQVVYKAIPEDATRMASLQAGEIDVCLAPALKDAQDYEKDAKFTVLTHDGGNMKQFVFNTSRAPFDNPKVRQAMAYAVDREGIVDAIYYGYATVGKDLVPPWNPYHDPNRTYYPYDPDKAKQLLSEAGYGSKPLEFEIVTTNATEFTDLATLIQAQLQEIGVNAKILSLDKSAFTAKTFALKVGTPNPNYQADVYRLIYAYATTDYTWRTYSKSSALDQSGYNQPGGAQNPEAQQTLDEITRTSDPAKLKELVGKASDLINGDMPVLLMAFQKNVVITRAVVKDLGIMVLSIMPLKDVWLDQ